MPLSFSVRYGIEHEAVQSLCHSRECDSHGAFHECGLHLRRAPRPVGVEQGAPLVAAVRVSGRQQALRGGVGYAASVVASPLLRWPLRPEGESHREAPWIGASCCAAPAWVSCLNPAYLDGILPQEVFQQTLNLRLKVCRDVRKVQLYLAVLTDDVKAEAIRSRMLLQ